MRTKPARNINPLYTVALLAVFVAPVLAFGQTATQEENSADARAQVRDAQRVISYFNKLNPPLVRVDKNTAPGGGAKLPPVQLTLAEAIARYVPRDYKVTLNPEVNGKTVLTYDPSLPWMEALGKSMAAVSLEMDANLYKKAMLVKAFETSLQEIIEKHVPRDFKVFTDAEVNVDSMLRYDERDHWADALGKSGQESGLDITANLTRKLIVIKPSITSNKDQTTKK